MEKMADGMEWFIFQSGHHYEGRGNEAIKNSRHFKVDKVGKRFGKCEFVFFLCVQVLQQRWRL